MVTRMLKDMGAWVWMLQRNDDRRSEIESMMAIVINGDARNDEDIERVFDEIDDLGSGNHEPAGMSININPYTNIILCSKGG